MKKISLKLVALIMLMTVSSNAQDFGIIAIRNASTSYPKFIVTINGIRLINQYTTTATFNMLDENQYRVKLWQVGASSMITYTLASEPNYLTKYVIMKDNLGNYTMVLESKSLMLAEPEMSDQKVTATQTSVPVQTLVPTQTLSTVPVNAVVTTRTEALATQPTTSVAITAIGSAEFQERLGAVRKEAFDKDKIGKVKQVFDDEYFTTNQVIDIVKSFAFDDSKLDVAKWCYKNTLDKKNYYKVEDNFSFTSSKKALADYVKKQPK